MQPENARVLPRFLNESMTPVHSSGQVNGIDEYRQADVGIGEPPVQLDRGPLSVGFSELAFPDVVVRRLSVNRRLLVNSEVPEGWTHFVLSPASPMGCSWCGDTVRPDSLSVMRSRLEHEYELPANWDDVEIGVRDELLLSRGIAPEYVPSLAVIPDRESIQLSTAYARTLRRWLRSLLNNYTAMESSGTNQLIARNLREIVLDELTMACGARS